MLISLPNSGDSYTFTVSDARFEVVDGVLRLTGGEVIDFETEGFSLYRCDSSGCGRLGCHGDVYGNG